MKNLDNIVKFEINKNTIKFQIDSPYFPPYGIITTIQNTFNTEINILDFLLFKNSLYQKFKEIKNSSKNYNFPLNIEVSIKNKKLILKIK